MSIPGLALALYGIPRLPCLVPDLHRDAYQLHGKRRGARKVRRMLRRGYKLLKWIHLDIDSGDVWTGDLPKMISVDFGHWVSGYDSEDIHVTP